MMMSTLRSKRHGSLSSSKAALVSRLRSKRCSSLRFGSKPAVRRAL